MSRYTNKIDRNFLNRDKTMPGFIIVSKSYRDDNLDHIELKISDCVRSIALEFDSGIDFKGRFNKKNNTDSLFKAKLIQKRINEIVEELEKAVPIKN